MTVGELIEALSKYKVDQPVCLQGPEYYCEDFEVDQADDWIVLEGENDA